jgi:hypothetical protein
MRQAPWFCKKTIKGGKMTKKNLTDIPIGIRADQIELSEHQAGYESK